LSHCVEHRDSQTVALNVPVASSARTTQHPAKACTQIRNKALVVQKGPKDCARPKRTFSLRYVLSKRMGLGCAWGLQGRLKVFIHGQPVSRGCGDGEIENRDHKPQVRSQFSIHLDQALKEIHSTEKRGNISSLNVSGAYRSFAPFPIQWK